MSAKSKRYDIWSTVTLIIFLIYIIMLVFPLLTILVKSVQDGDTGSFSLAYFKQFFSKKYYYGSLFNSLKVTTCVTILTIILAIPLAYIMATFKIKGKSAIQVLILISSMQAPFIGAYSWILLLGRNGVITNFMENTFNITMPDIYGFTGILLVLTLQLVPLIYMYLYGALKNIDKSLLEAAESMGCTGAKRYLKWLFTNFTYFISRGFIGVYVGRLWYSNLLRRL